MSPLLPKTEDVCLAILNVVKCISAQLETLLKRFGNRSHSIFPQSTNDHFVIMPNHIHGIIELVGARHAVPHDERFGKPVSGSIPTIIRSFKSETTRRINLHRNSPGGKVWQRNFYEHVIRNEKELQTFYDYIYTNPLNWPNDDEYVVK